MKVLKFGGSSLSTPERMKNVIEIVTKNDQAVVVLSAIGDTTNELTFLLRIYQERNGKPIDKLKEIINFHIDYSIELFQTEAKLNEALFAIKKEQEKVHERMNATFLTQSDESRILALGEILSTIIFEMYLQEIGALTNFVNAFDVMKLNEQGDPDFYFIIKQWNDILKRKEEVEFNIVQGYICLDVNGDFSNLKRGGSDYSATIIGSAIQAECIEIWTDIDGIHNNDPRIIRDTKSVDEISYEEAEELAYFGAKILHPTCVWPAKKQGTPIMLKNTLNPTQLGTKISNKSRFPRREFTAIAAKDEITSISIHSGRMLNAYGFLCRIFEIFEKYKTAVDMITTSEVSVALTIDDAKNLSAIVEDLATIGTVKVHNDLSIVCIVGNFSGDKKGGAKKIFHALANVPVKAISYGSSENNVSILVDTNNKNQALEELHTGLFLNNEVYEGIY